MWLAAEAGPGQIARLGTVGCSFLLVLWIRASMRALAVTPLMPRVIRRRSDLWSPKIAR
jgi:hypothetical protein